MNPYRRREYDPVEEVSSFIIDNGIATLDEVQLVTGINGWTVKSLDDIIFYKTGFHSVEQLFDCCRDEFDFSMVSGLDDEDVDDDF